MSTLPERIDSYTMTSSGRGLYIIYGKRGTRIIGTPICPDLLDYEALGAADNLRGRVVRAFFSVLRLWPAA